jgi:hypothetical protein
MLLLLVDSVLTFSEAKRRGRLRGSKLIKRPTNIPPGILEDARTLSNLLEKSIGVEEYFEGAVYLKSMWVSWPRRRIYLGKQGAESGTNRSLQTRGVDIDDIAEVRAGQVVESIDRGITNADPKRVMPVGLCNHAHCIEFKFICILDDYYNWE